MHGGGSPGAPVVTGLHSKKLRGAMLRAVRAASAMDDPFDLSAELAVARALLARKLEQIGDSDISSRDLMSMSMLTSNIAGIVEKAIRAHHQTAFTPTELRFITAAMESLLDEFIPDPNRRRAFIARLRALVHGQPCSRAGNYRAG